MDISQRNLLELAMSSLPTGLFICDRDASSVHQRRYANYLRVRPEDAMGRHITDSSPIPASRRSSLPASRNSRMAEHTGSERKILVNRIPLRDQDGHVIGAFSLTLFDTPEQMQALLQRVDFLDKKVNSYARRIKSALRASHTINSILGNSPPTHGVQVLPAALRADRIAGPHPRRDRNRQRTGGQRNPHGEQPARRPFVSINCAAIPKELFESEVFGYVPGPSPARTRTAKSGRSNWPIKAPVPRRSGGSSLHAQVKLLRVLEEKTLSRLGSSQPRAVDFRLVAATNRDLKKMIAAGTFREDCTTASTP